VKQHKLFLTAFAQIYVAVFLRLHRLLISLVFLPSLFFYTYPLAELLKTVVSKKTCTLCVLLCLFE